MAGLFDLMFPPRVDGPLEPMLGEPKSVLASRSPQGILSQALNQPLPMDGRLTFLPAMVNNGRREFALPGLLASAWNAFTAPGRAYSGNMADPVGEALNVAGMMQLGAMPLPTPSGHGVLGVIPVSTAKSLNTAKNIPQSETFVQAVKNTPGAQLTDDGLQMRVMRNQQPQQGLQDSVRGGVFYLPEGSANARHYTTKANNYGGPERVTGETLYSNPMFVKGATGGKAPEAAYDALKGKGAYQKMREDAIQWGGAPRDVRVEAVTKFLETYAPEMANQADYIIQNSTRGNQLYYALQEAAVGSAVRSAGHDAVLGYSMARSTKQPFISEVFDVRQRTYPDKFGSPTDIWERYLRDK